MNRFLCLLVLLALSCHISAQEIQNEKTSEWKTYRKLSFSIDGKNAWVIFPHQAAAGNPWVWRARFPTWHTETDSILLKRGFHVAYICTDGMYGAPKAIDAWDQFYRYLTQKYQLNAKVALEGVSRGGLFVYGFAKRFPERVNCIYAEAPVCDIRSWPGGKGKGAGSPNDWQKLLSIYNFTEEQAMSYADNPIDNLEKLAAAKVPIWHGIGLHDSIVPPDENTFKLVKKYIELGGTATISPNTKGKQSLQGHHFPIDDPLAIADFIERNSMQNAILSPLNYHTFRDLLKNAQMVFERTKKGRVAFLGGSITFNNGWRDSIMNYLQKKFPETEFDFIKAGIPSMGTTPGAFRLKRDVLSKGKIDLLFEEAAVNDRVNEYGPTERIRGMEGIVRHTLQANPECDIVIMHFVDPDKMNDYRNGIVPAEITDHENVARHYNISTINLAKEVTERIDAGEFSWENDFKNLHPSPFGQQVYYRSMKAFLNFCWSGFVANDDKVEAHKLPEMLDPFCYNQGKLIAGNTIKPAKGWQIDENWTPKDGLSTRPNYVNVPMLVCEIPGKIQEFTFTGKAVGIAVAAGSDAGIVEYKIDNEEWQTKDLFTKWSKSLHLPWYYTLKADLPEGKHRLKIRLAETSNPQSAGHACRIRYFYVNE